MGDEERWDNELHASLSVSQPQEIDAEAKLDMNSSSKERAFAFWRPKTINDDEARRY